MSHVQLASFVCTVINLLLMLVMQLKDCSYAQRARKYKLMIYFVVTFFTYILRHEPGLHFVQFKNIIKRGRPDNKEGEGRCYFETGFLDLCMTHLF